MTKQKETARGRHRERKTARERDREKETEKRDKEKRQGQTTRDEVTEIVTDKRTETAKDRHHNKHRVSTNMKYCYVLLVTTTNF